MSAGAIGVLAPEPVCMPSHTARPRLRLVAADERFQPGSRVRPGGAVSHAGRAYAPWCPTTRLTRRGRLVITMMATAALLALAVTLVVALATAVYAAVPQIDHSTTVSAGQTLSEVAVTQMPGLTVNDAVARIQLANGMNTLQVHAGQRLLIPAVR